MTVIGRGPLFSCGALRRVVAVMLRCLAQCHGGGAVYAAFDGAVSYGMALPLAGGCGVSRVACGVVAGSLPYCCGVSAHVHETRVILYFIYFIVNICATIFHIIFFR
ncbi:hypothetical protein E2C01_072483 [Portunus trituberculatus]|uniref:Uncharacterized protein n=1 Tax=Portunus trituberculatus TaxID=210409 RepID=A0A5B7I2Q6_PORTR|nr:hypothetical protein [Portunus trituberculatus]